MSGTDAALVTIEKRVLTRAGSTVEAAATHLRSYLASVLRTDPAPSGTELLSRPDVHQMLTGLYDSARDSCLTALRTGYRAAAALGRADTTTQFTAAGHTTPVNPELGGYLNAVLIDVTTAFARTRTELQNRIRAGYDGVSGPNAGAARVLAVDGAVTAASSRLAGRVRTAGAVVVHRGFSDAQVALARALQDTHPGAVVLKRWQSTTATLCPACTALDGTTIAMIDQFDHTATTDPTITPPRVYRDLHGPPRHPHCRCRLTLKVITTGI